MQNKFAVIITALLVMIMVSGSAMCATTYDSNVTLENKYSNWTIIEDDISAIVDFIGSNDRFMWQVTGNTGVEDTFLF